MRPELVEHHQLAGYLAGLGPAGLFARYVVARQPHAASRAVVANGAIRGVVIAGRDHGLFEAYPHWLFADSGDVAALLASTLERDAIALNVRSDHLGAVLEAIDDDAIEISHDLIHMLEAPPPVTDVPASMGIERLSADELRRLEIAPELTRLLGVLDDWRDESRLLGIVDGHQLVCIAEAQVRDESLAAIQQVHTSESHRGRGLARALVARVASAIQAEGLTPVYIVTETNGSSVRVAEALGFTLRDRWGYLESRSPRATAAPQPSWASSERGDG